MALATRNVRDFAGMGLIVIDPWRHEPTMRDDVGSRDA
jgi:hypothetical protein